MKLWPPRSLTNAALFPSGDHLGCWLLPRANVSGFAFSLPEVGATQICFFADHSASSRLGEIWMSSQPPSLHPISPSSRGTPLSIRTAHTCCVRFSTLLVGSAVSPAPLASVPRA
jgi:hypothetical protein